MGKALKASELAQSATAKFVEKERVAAQELIALSKDVAEAADYLETARMGFWATAVLAFAVQGCTKDGMEAAEPSLKDVTAWRSACSTVKAAREHKVKLLDDDGLPRSKGDIQKDVKAAKEKAAKKAGQTPDPVDVPEESGAGVRKATDAEIVNLALNALHQSKNCATSSARHCAMWCGWMRRKKRRAPKYRKPMHRCSRRPKRWKYAN
jgi:hypothetical protein